MNRVILRLSFFCLTAVTPVFTSCFGKKTVEFGFENSLAIAPDTEWARIEVPFVSYYEDCSFKSPVINSGRRGDIELVTGKKTVRTEDGKEVRWYIFKKGCLEESSLSIFNNYLRASQK